MNHQERESLYSRARLAIRRGLLTEANNMFQELVVACDTDARFVSYRGLLVGVRERQVAEGVVMCKRAIALASSEPQMYLNLVRLHMSADQRDSALAVLRDAIRRGVKEKIIMAEIQRLSPRSRTIKSLHRRHFLNKFLGKLRARLRRSRRDVSGSPVLAQQASRS